MLVDIGDLGSVASAIYTVAGVIAAGGAMLGKILWRFDRRIFRLELHNGLKER